MNQTTISQASKREFSLDLLRVLACASRWGSGIEVPSDDQDFWQVKNVPQGSMSEVYYYSTYTEKMRRCFVYLPNEYFTNPTKKFPVLYLQHGMGENEYSWPYQGCVTAPYARRRSSLWVRTLVQPRN